MRKLYLVDFENAAAEKEWLYFDQLTPAVQEQVLIKFPHAERHDQQQQRKLAACLGPFHIETEVDEEAAIEEALGLEPLRQRRPPIAEYDEPASPRRKRKRKVPGDPKAVKSEPGEPVERKAVRARRPYRKGSKPSYSRNKKIANKNRPVKQHDSEPAKSCGHKPSRGGHKRQTAAARERARLLAEQVLFVNTGCRSETSTGKGPQAAEDSRF